MILSPHTRVRIYIYSLIVLGGIMTSAAVFPLVKDRLTSVPKYDTSQITHFVEVLISKTPEAGEQVTVKPAAGKALLPGAKWVPQTFNNCGPATTSMVLQYFGHNVDQNITKAALRTNADDKNVFTYEMRDYLKNSYDINSHIFYNGTPERLKVLISNGFYIVVEDWLHPNEDIGHVTIIKGYDDKKGVFIADDSFIGINIMYKYEEFETGQWKAFNRQYLPVYAGDQEELLKAIVGEDWDEATMYHNAIELNQAAVEADPKDMYAWFNLGTSYYSLGNYNTARTAFEKSRELGWPRRMLWYQIQPIQTYNKLGEYQKALELARIGLAGNDSFAELHYESVLAYKGLGDNTKAKAEIAKTLQYSPNFQPAKDLQISL